MRRGLQQLVEAEFLYQQGLPPQATYLFKHALIQDAAYQSLLRSTRQQHHQHIAQVVEGRFPEVCETQPELLAHHYTEAGLLAQAVDYWQRAGEKAIQSSAYVEATAHFTKGLEALKALPDTPKRTQRELNVQIAFGQALAATKGQAAPEVECAYTRARELCQQMGETQKLFPVLWGLFRFYNTRAEFQAARELGEHLLTLAQRIQDPLLLAAAYRAMGTTLFELGELASARAHLEQGIALYDPQQHRPVGMQDPGVSCRYWVARALWELGYPDQALQRGYEALTLARELSHPYSLAAALGYTAMLHQHRREVQAAQEQAEAVIALSTEQGFALYLPLGTILRGWALAAYGQAAEGIAHMHQGLAAWRATSAARSGPHFLALLAEAYGKIGQTEEGLRLLVEALAMVDNGGERYYEAELHRLKGELLLALSAENRTAAAACFHQALDIARRQQAKSLELRAAVSLGQLWQRQGKRTEAHALLAPIYGWFTEGFDTADLQEAWALLEALV